MNDKQTIKLNVDKDELQEISERLGVKIAQHGDVIEIDGNDEEIDAAMHDIMELTQVYEEQVDEKDDLLFVGNVINGNTSKPSYFKYQLLEYDPATQRWLCDVQKKVRHWQNGRITYETVRVGKWWMPVPELLEEHFSGRK